MHVHFAIFLYRKQTKVSNCKNTLQIFTSKDLQCALCLLGTKKMFVRMRASVSKKMKKPRPRIACRGSRLVSQKGFEPPTPALGGRCSVQLSY